MSVFKATTMKWLTSMNLCGLTHDAYLKRAYGLIRVEKLGRKKGQIEKALAKMNPGKVALDNAACKSKMSEALRDEMLLDAFIFAEIGMDESPHNVAKKDIDAAANGFNGIQSLFYLAGENNEDAKTLTLLCSNELRITIFFPGSPLVKTDINLSVHSEHLEAMEEKPEPLHDH